MELLPVLFPEEQKPWYQRTDWARTPEFWLKFAAYAIPGAFLLYVLYWNFLPFGYDQTFTIEVGSTSDTSGQFRLEPSRDLSERKTAPDGTTYRELNGLAFAVFEPKAVLKDATVTVTVQGDGVALTPLQLDFDPSSVKWDNAWDFTSSTPFTDTVTKRNLVGSAFPFDGCMYFDGNSQLELPYSYNQFETGPFSVYVEWKPEDKKGRAQQLAGHLNWELWQNTNSVEFQVGRMNNINGVFYSVKYPVDETFFNQKHSALAVYAPSNNGYIDLYVDGGYAGRTYIGKDIIWPFYNGTKNLALGKSDHGIATYFQGCIYNVDYARQNWISSNQKTTFMANGSDIHILLESLKLSVAREVKIHVEE